MTDHTPVLTPEKRAILALTALYDERVQRGGAFLNATFPEWRTTMVKHLRAFHIDSTKSCVIGTLARFDMAQFRTAIRRKLRLRGVDAAYFIGLETMGGIQDCPTESYGRADWAIGHGFSIGSATEEELLTRLGTSARYALLQETWMRYLAPTEI